MMLIAEEFVLLCLRPNGRLARAGHHANFAAGTKGALLAELVIGHHLEITDELIRPTGTRPDNGLLAATLDDLASNAGNRLTGARIRSLKQAGWNEVTAQMTQHGLLGPRRFPPIPARWPIADPTTHERVLSEVRAASTGTLPLNERLAILLSLAGHCQALEVVAPDRAHRAAAKEAIDAATEFVPGLKAIALAAKFGTPSSL